MSEMNSIELQKVYNLADSLGRYAGTKIKEGFYGGLVDSSVQSKADPSDLVTKYDQEIENEIKKRIKEEFPSHKFIGEETDASGVSWTLTDDPTWIIDPIDGTSNFVHGFPYVCVSIAFALNRTPVIGVVYNPILDEFFSARKGQGSYLNGTKLPLRNPTSRILKEPEHCLMLGEYGGMREAASLAPKSSSLYNLALNKQDSGAGCRGIRCLGSAAMNLCMIAKGSADIYWEVGPYIWDFAAGLLILQEAGGFAVSHSTESGFPQTLEEARRFDLMARTVFAVRSVAEVPTDRPRNDTESSEADLKALNLLRKIVKFIDVVPIPKSKN